MKGNVSKSCDEKKNANRRHQLASPFKTKWSSQNPHNGASVRLCQVDRKELFYLYLGS